jgi:hypothetical protein
MNGSSFRNVNRKYLPERRQSDLVRRTLSRKTEQTLKWDVLIPPFYKVFNFLTFFRVVQQVDYQVIKVLGVCDSVGAGEGSS